MQQKQQRLVASEALAEQQAYEKRIRDENARCFEQTGRQKLAFVRTYGCQQNVSDGEKLKGMLAEMGFGFAPDPESADVVIFNTCAVRENAEDRVFGNVGALKAAKRRNPGMVIGLCGCMMQQAHIAEKIKKSFPYVDLVFGTHALYRMPALLAGVLETHGRVFDIENSDGQVAEGLPVRRDSSLKAWLPIMYGCDNFCSYCVVPFVRGRERSRSSGEILAEARGLVAQGYKEITLLGQNVNSYGKGLAEEITFSELLRRLNALEGDFRIRFMTSHPKDASPALIDTIAECDKVCSHLHLPVQSGSNRVLRAMNRKYTREQYLSLIEYAKQRAPDISFTSDIIVGFPGETYEEFQETLSLVRAVGYDSLFTFIYSSRVGTAAAKLPNPVPAQEKSRWFGELLALQERIGEQRMQALVGKTVRVLAEGPGREGMLTGRTEQNIICDFKAPAALAGQFVDLTVVRARHSAVEGVLK